MFERYIIRQDERITIKNALALMNSMIKSGELHTAKSEEVFSTAISVVNKVKDRLLVSRFSKVKDFMEAFEVSKVPSQDNLKRLYKCLFEEVIELGEALGLRETIHDLLFNTFADYNVMQEVTDEYGTTFDMPVPCEDGNFYEEEQVIDAVIDMEYFSNQILISTGLDEHYDEAFDLVHKANMKKLVDGKVIRSDGTDGNPEGKILKPEGWKPAKISALLRSVEKRGHSIVNYED